MYAIQTYINMEWAQGLDCVSFFASNQKLWISNERSSVCDDKIQYELRGVEFVFRENLLFNWRVHYGSVCVCRIEYGWRFPLTGARLRRLIKNLKRPVHSHAKRANWRAPCELFESKRCSFILTGYSKLDNYLEDYHKSLIRWPHIITQGTY